LDYLVLRNDESLFLITLFRLMKTFYIEDLDFEKTNKFLDEIELS